MEGQPIHKNKNLQVEVQVVTLEDNLDHPYFSLVELAEDNVSPIGIAKVEAPYTPHISNYWIKYKGIVVISFDMSDLKHTNTNSTSFFDLLSKAQTKAENFTSLNQRIQNDYYNYSFICKISRFKQKGKKFIIEFEDLGWKFLQKVPKEFRDTYVAGQSLDDAFQAICEFLGVDFAYSIEDLSKYTFGSDGYSIQKDGQTVEDVTTILSEWGSETIEEAEEEEKQEDPDGLGLHQYENETVKELDEKNKDNKNYTKSDENTNPQLSEEEPDASQEKIEKYQEEFDRKILDLFVGNSYYESNLVDPILNYSSITITPKITENNSSSSPSVVGETGETNTETQVGQELINRSNTGITLSGINIQNKIALSYDQVNSLTPDQAYQESFKTDKYYNTTIIRLRARARFKYNIGPTTPYWRVS